MSSCLYVCLRFWLGFLGDCDFLKSPHFTGLIQMPLLHQSSSFGNFIFWNYNYNNSLYRLACKWIFFWLNRKVHQFILLVQKKTTTEMFANSRVLLVLSTFHLTESDLCFCGWNLSADVSSLRSCIMFFMPANTVGYSIRTICEHSVVSLFEPRIFEYCKWIILNLILISRRRQVQ